MIARTQLTGLCAVAALLLALALLLAPPTAVLALALAAIGAALAFRSPVFPLALAPVVPLCLQLVGSEPLTRNGLAVISLSWLAVGIVVAVIRDEQALPPSVLLSVPLALTLALGIWIAIRSTHGGSTLELFFVANVAPLVAAVIVGRRSRDLELLAKLLAAAGLVGALVLWRSGARIGSPVGPGSPFDPLLAVETAALGLLAALWLAVRRHALTIRLASLAAVPFLAGAIVVGAPRGPLLALSAGILTVLAVAPTRRTNRVLGRTLGVGAAAAAILCAIVVPGVTWTAVGKGLLGAPGLGHGWRAAADAFRADWPAGVGLGGLTRSPHSLVLGAAAQLGLPGLVLLLGALAAAARPIVRRRRLPAAERGDASLAMGVFAFAVPFGLLTSDLGGNAVAWIAAGLVLGLAQRKAIPAEAILEMRPRRDAPVRRPAAERAPAPRPAAGPTIVSRGRIVSPSNGATVSGTVTVVAEPAVTSAAVAALTIEVSGTDGRWHELPRDEGFELLAPDRRLLAVVRTRELAEIVRDALAGEGMETTLARSESPPWAGEPTAELDSAGLAEGSYRLRAVTVDAAGTRVESPEREIAVVSAPQPEPVPEPEPELEPEPEPEPIPEEIALSLEDPGALLRSEVEVRVRVASGAPDDVELQVVKVGRRDWRTLSRAAAPFLLVLDTAELDDGLYDLRVRALVGGQAVAESQAVRGRRVDNTPPRVAVIEPSTGASLTGGVRLRADAADGGSGVASVLFQFEQEGVWRPVVAESADPQEVMWDTTRVADGAARVRATAVDSAGNSTVSAPVALWIANRPAVELVASEAPAPAVGDSPTLFELEHLVAARPHPDPYVQAEREAVLFHLRAYASSDGTIPAEFDELARESFGEFFA